MPEELKLGKNGNSGPGQREPRCTSSPDTHARGRSGNSREARQGSRDAHHEGRTPARAGWQGTRQPLSDSCPPLSFPRAFLEDPAPGTERRPTEGTTGTPEKLRHPLRPGRGHRQASRPAGFPEDSKPDPGATAGEAANGGSNPGPNATCGPRSALQLTIPVPQTRRWPPIAPCLPYPNCALLGDPWGSAPGPQPLRPGPPGRSAPSPATRSGTRPNSCSSSSIVRSGVEARALPRTRESGSASLARSPRASISRQSVISCGAGGLALTRES